MRYCTVLIDQITICIMLNHETAWIEPIIEDLASKDMPSDTPTGVVAFRSQEVVPKVLNIEIMYLES